MANLKAMESDWFAQTYMGRKTKVNIAAVGSSRLFLAVLNTCPFAGRSPSHGEDQPVGRLPVYRSSVRGHGLQAGDGHGSPSAEGGRTVRTGDGVRRRRTGKRGGGAAAAKPASHSVSHTLFLCFAGTRHADRGLPPVASPTRRASQRRDGSTSLPRSESHRVNVTFVQIHLCLEPDKL